MVALLELGLACNRAHGALPSERQLDQVFAFFSQVARSDEDAQVRRAAAYELTFWGQKRAAKVLLEVFQKANEDPGVRGQAAEGIGANLEVGDDRIIEKSPLRDAAIEALRAGLGEQSVEVRFWCIYALGQLFATDARAALQALEGDEAVGPMTWTVGQEVKDVLAYWDTGVWIERQPSWPL